MVDVDAPAGGQFRVRGLMAAWIAASASVLVAVLAGLFTYRNNRSLKVREDRLARVNEQLEHLYGPLYALSQASSTVFATFQARHPHGWVFGSEPELTTEQRELWVQWMRTVFMPINRRSYELIVSKAHLLDGDTMPRCMLDLCAHVAGYEAVMDRWAQGDTSTIGSLVDHPGAPYVDHIEQAFAELKQRQQKLLSRSRED